MFGELVRLHRRRRGLTQEELAERVGISVRTVGKLEANRIGVPRPATVGLLADAFELSGEDRERFCDAAFGQGETQDDPSSHPVESPVRTTPAQLPADVMGFVGRSEQLDVLTSLVGRVASQLAADGEGRAVVITAIGGTAGVGKTALAVRWAHRVRPRFPDGQLYINLRGYDPDKPMAVTDALAGFLRALGVPSRDIPPTLDERAAVYRTLLGSRQMLVLLDNASSEEQVRPLLPGTASCVALVTSRDSLAGLVAREGAVRVAVDVLPLTDAVALLRALVGRRVDDDISSAVALADQCARLPLALRVAAEIAASRPMVPVADLVAELGDEQARLRLLDAGSDDRTRVGVVFSWSYRGLPADAARLFRLIGLLPAADVTPYAAAAMVDSSLDYARALLDLLVRAHLVEQAAHDRYTMHDLLRAYAADLAEATESEVERHAALTRLFDHYLATSARASETLHPGEGQRRPAVITASTPSPPVAETAQAGAWLDTELATIARICRYAADNGWPRHAIDLSAVLYRHLNVTGQLEGLAIHAAARDAARRTGDTSAEAAALVRRGIELGRRGAVTDAEQSLREGIDLARQTQDLLTEGMGLGGLAIIFWLLGRYADTASLLQQGLEVHRRSGDVIGQSAVLQNLGALGYLQGRWAQSRQYLTEAIAAAKQIGFRDTEVNILCGIAEIDIREGHFDDALAHLDEARAVAKAMGNRMGETTVARELGLLRLHQGRFDEAVEPLLTAIDVYERLGIHDGAVMAMSRLAEVRRWQGDVDSSVDLLDRTLDLLKNNGDVAELCLARARLGMTRHAMGDLDDALKQLEEAVALAVGAGLRYEEAMARAALAEVHRECGADRSAWDELSQALALYEDLNAPEAPRLRARIAQLRQERGGPFGD